MNSKELMTLGNKIDFEELLEIKLLFLKKEVRRRWMASNK